MFFASSTETEREHLHHTIELVEGDSRSRTMGGAPPLILCHERTVGTDVVLRLLVELVGPVSVFHKV